MSETAALIRKLQQSGLTQTAIGAMTGIPQPRLSRWAAGEVPASVDDALKLKALCDSQAGEGAPAAEGARHA
jgi:predicted XRE-type DNA-binding protein